MSSDKKWHLICSKQYELACISLLILRLWANNSVRIPYKYCNLEWSDITMSGDLFNIQFIRSKTSFLFIPDKWVKKLKDLKRLEDVSIILKYLLIEHVMQWAVHKIADNVFTPHPGPLNYPLWVVKCKFHNIPFIWIILNLQWFTSWMSNDIQQT